MTAVVDSVLIDDNEGEFELVLGTDDGEHRYRLPAGAALGLLLEADRKVGPYAAEIPGPWHKIAAVG